jgi:hypothetical protein
MRSGNEYCLKHLQSSSCVDPSNGDRLWSGTARSKSQLQHSSSMREEYAESANNGYLFKDPHDDSRARGQRQSRPLSRAEEHVGSG